MRVTKNIPKLRFKEFKDEWVISRLGSLIQIRSGFSPSSYKLGPSGKFPFLKVEELNNSTKYQSQSRFYTDERKDIIPSGSVIFPKRGAAILNNKVRISIVDVLLDSNLMAVTPLEKSLNAEFLYYKIYLEKLYKIADTSTIPQINNKHIEPYKIPLPSLPEQQKIASFLSAVDEKIQQLTRKKELLEQYKKGVMQQLFPPAGGQASKLRFKPDLTEASGDDNGKTYPKWEEKKLGDVGDIVSGLTYSPEDVNENGILVLRSSNVQERKIVFDDNVYVNVSEGEFNPVKENDILICVRNGSKDLIGKNAIIDKNSSGLAFGAFMTVFRSKYNKYLFHLFDSDNYKKAVHRNLGATINSINGSDLKKFKVPFPSEIEQQKIASFLTALDAKIESVAVQIAHTQTFKKGLLQQMFV